ncbi:vitamin D3 receptor B-like [Saccoglossus kowalevskii]|uniref:Nuclear receptor LXR-like protein n=2 Tax=Saccoglossus kowalevskii TaxID=10224 RepID=A0A1C9TA59_SACKO|nr:nuclear receptor LXR-like protein [Saccoglossus kowalevskii]
MSDDAGTLSPSSSLDSIAVTQSDTEIIPTSPTGSSQSRSGQQSSEKGLCLICGDNANGVHYNVLSCEGCKSFFLRSVKSKASFVCSESNNCEMDLYTRRHCPACRMKKCMQLGMTAEKVWDGERLRKRKPLVRTKKKRMQYVIQPVTPPKPSSITPPLPSTTELSKEQSNLVRLLEKSFVQSKQVYKELAPQLSPPLQQTMEAATIAGNSPRMELWSQLATSSSSSSSSTLSSTTSSLKRPNSNQEHVGKGKKSKRQHKDKNAGDLEKVVDSTNETSATENTTLQEVQEREIHNEMQKSLENAGIDATTAFILSRSEGSQPKMQICKELVNHAMDLFAVTVKQIIFFAKSIPGFSQLSCDDQAALIRAAIMETIIIRCTERFDPDQNLLISDINEGEYGLNLIFQLGYKTFTEPFFQFMREMKHLNLAMEEYALLQAAIILQSDRPDLKDANLVEKIQFPIILALQMCTKKNHPEEPALFAKLMLKMVTLRDIDAVHSKDLMDMKLQEQEFTPLVQELFGLSD